jgi:peptide/nickel transport system substrate-binding protein
MKLRPAIPLAAVLTLLAASCSSSAPTSGSNAGAATIPQLKVGLASSFPSLDLAKTINANYVDVLSLETLMKFGPHGQVAPNLATSVTRPDPLTYAYHLRHGVTFWNGDPLTAADAAYSMNHERALGSQVAFTYSSVDSITATDPYTVTVTLTRPDATWQYTAAEYTSAIFEMKFAQAHQGTFGGSKALIMGSGPWEIDSFDPTKGVELSANPHWWGGKVPFSHIAVTFFANATSEALAFRAGNIDLAPDISQPRTFAATSGATLISVPSCSNTWFAMNTQVAPWSDIHVRRSVAYALNRTDIIAAGGGYATPIYTLIPPELLRSIAAQARISTLLNSIPRYSYDLAKAKQEMAQSAYPHGFTATISEYNWSDATNISQVIAAELAKIGIKLQIKYLDVIAWQGLQTGPDTKRSTVYASGGCFNPDPNAYSDFLGSQNLKPGQWNIADYAPAAVDKLLAAGVATSDPTKRFAIYSQLFARLQADEPYVGLSVSDITLALSPKFAYSGFNEWFAYSPYPLNIKAAA